MKAYSLRAWLLLLLPLCVAFTCSDHREPQPLRYRVKTITYSSATYPDGSYSPLSSFTLTYDASGCLTRYTHNNEGFYALGTNVTCGANGLPRIMDRGINKLLTGYAFYYYNSQNQLTTISIKQGYAGSSSESSSPFAMYNFFYEGNSTRPSHRITSVYTGASPRPTYREDYVFEGGNAVRVGGQSYTYDKTPNPYKGLIGFNPYDYLTLDYTLQGEQTYVKTTSSNLGRGFVDYEVKVFNENNVTNNAQLTYNANGLVTRITYDSGLCEEFTYESY